MKVTLRLLGASNRPVDIGNGVKIPDWYYQYWAVAENGLVDVIEDVNYLEDGVYDIPNFMEVSEDEDDLLGSTPSRQVGSGTKRYVCEIAAFCWT